MKIRPPVKWHGGKYYLAQKIIQYFPEHHTYIEPYGGCASVLLNKESSKVEIYNDINRNITNLFNVLRDHGEELRQRLQLSPYGEPEFHDSDFSEPCDNIERARLDFIRWRQSIGGRGDAISLTLHRSRRGMADVVSGYLSAIDEQLPLITERLRRVQILCRPAVDVIKKWDSLDTLIYCDPPYVHSTRITPDVYSNEMSWEEHLGLETLLNNCKSKVIISGYPSVDYYDWCQGW